MGKNYTQVWKDIYKIHSYEMDLQGRISVTSLLQYMQETAWNHAEHLDVGYSHLLEKSLVWVLSRLALKIFSYPKWGEAIELYTWPSGIDKLFCYRDFKFLDSKGNTCAGATTTWFAIDLNRRRPVKTETYIDLQAGSAERMFPNFVPKIASVVHPSSAKKVNVEYSFLDVNGHVNNVRLVEIILDSFSIDFRKEFFLNEFQINFLNEALAGDEIGVSNSTQDNSEYQHMLLRKRDDAELCRAITRWRKK